MYCKPILFRTIFSLSFYLINIWAFFEQIVVQMLIFLISDKQFLYIPSDISQAVGFLDLVSPTVIAIGSPWLFAAIHAISIRADLFDQKVVPVIEVTGDPSLRVLLLDLPVFQAIPMLPADHLSFPLFL